MNDELQTEDGFQIGTKQDPPFTNYTPTKYKVEDDDTVGRGSHFTTDVKNEPKIEDLDRCDVCDKSITNDTLQSASITGNNSNSKARRNPSRSAKRDVMYPENDCETMADSNNDTHFSNGDQCWKCGKLKPDVEGKAGMMEMDNQSESELIDHQQSASEDPSVKGKRFKCKVCSKKFTTSRWLKLHIRTVHDKVRAFPCPHCPYKATQSQHLKSHILTHTGEKNFKCDICEKMFTQGSYLKLHIRTVHNKVKAFPCPHCLYKATTSGSLKNHILTHTGEKNFKCDICDKKFSISSRLTQHIRAVHDKVKPFPCPHCSYRAAEHGSLKVHLLTHTGEKNFKCDICDNMFVHRGYLKVHIRTVHDKVKAFPCPHCPHEATTSGSLKNHILTHTGEKNFKCDICDKKFTRNGDLKLHIREIHDKVKAFPCPHCPHKAKRKDHLKYHILTHTGEKNFRCDICDKMFVYRGYLKVHISTVHDKVRAFPCPHCPYKATTSGSFKNHILTHTGEKNFKCDICDKKFTLNDSLKLHIRTVHDRIRAFSCPHCPHKPATSCALNRHILTHTGEKNFKCDICDKKFAQKGNLNRHIRTVHDKDN